MLDEGEHSGRHEPSRPDRAATAGQLGHFHDASTMPNLDPPAGASRLDLVREGAPTGVYNDLDSVTFHMDLGSLCSVYHIMTTTADIALFQVSSGPTVHARKRCVTVRAVITCRAR
jgi:hypothetical protein